MTPPTQEMPTTITIDSRDVLVEICLRLLDGHTHASALMPWRTPGPIRWPDDPCERRVLVQAHIAGSPSRITYVPADGPRRIIDVDGLVLFALCPRPDGRCPWLAIDLDAAVGHGSGGLVDPTYAARCIAERADAFGLFDGLIVARSRSGKGYHNWLVFAEPIPLADAVVGVGMLAAHGWLATDRDVHDYGCEHAFRCADGTIARPGKPGAFELMPHSSSAPRLGWSMVLPGAGVFAASGGGVIVDAFSGKPTELRDAPSCNPTAWAALVETARCTATIPRRPCRPPTSVSSRDPLDRLDTRTQAFIDGQVDAGRNDALFAATCNMIGVGMDPHRAVRLAMVPPEHMAPRACRGSCIHLR